MKSLAGAIAAAIHSGVIWSGLIWSGLIWSGTASAQTALPVYDPKSVALLSFRPGNSDTLLLATVDNQHRLLAHIVRLAADGHATLARTLPEAFSAAAWLDDGHIVTAGADGRLQSWPLVGDGPALLATLPEPILGLGVGPITHGLALRLGQTLRLHGSDGRPNGATITLGRPVKPSDSCPPEGIDPTPIFSPDERLISFSGLCGDLRVIGRDGTRLMHADIARGFVRRQAFSADGKMLLVSYAGAGAGLAAGQTSAAPPGGADFWPVTPGRLGNPRPLAGPIDANDPFDLVALPDRPGFLVLSTGRVRFLGSDGALLQADLTLAAPRRAAVSADGSRIAIAAAEGLVVFDASGRRLQAHPFDAFGTPVALLLVAGGSQIAAVSREGVLRVWRLDGAEARTPIVAWDAQGLPPDVLRRPARLLLSPNGRRVGVLAPTGQFEVFDESWNRLGRPIRFPSDTSSLLANATLLLDDRVLRPLPGGAGFLAFDFDGRVLGRVAYGAGQTIEAAAAAASLASMAVYAADGRLVAWGGEGRPLRQRKIETPRLVEPRLDITPDGRTVVLHDAKASPPQLVVWRPDDETLQSRVGVFAGLLADGSVLRLSSGRLIVDAPGGAPRTMVPVDADAVAAVTADGKMALVTKNGVAKTVKVLADRP